MDNKMTATRGWLVRWLLSSWLPGVCSVSLKPVDLGITHARHGAEQFTVLVDDPQRGVAESMVTGWPAGRKPTWGRWPATWMPPRLDTFR
jgi:hypothetical protein